MKIKLIILFLFLSFSTFAQLDLVTPFKDCNLTGSITIYDYKKQKWIISNEADSRKQTLGNVPRGVTF